MREALVKRHRRDLFTMATKLPPRILKEKGPALFAIKSQSIDVTAKPKDTYEAILVFLAREFEISERINLMPFDKDHLFVSLRKK